MLLHQYSALSHTSFFTMEFFTKTNITFVPQPTLLFFLSPTEDKTVGRHFDIFEVIGAGLQTVLNTQHGFQDAF
jgi:hypothetical protein